MTHYAALYGANQSMCAMMLELREHHNIEPIVLVPRAGPVCEFLDENEMPYFVSHYYWWVNQDRGPFKALLNLRKQVLNRQRISQISRLFSSLAVDLVYSNSIVVNIGYYISKRLHCPHIWHLRESLNSYKFKFSLGTDLSKYFLSFSAQRFILISDFLVKEYSSLLPSKKVRRIYNGVSLPERTGKRKTPSVVLNIGLVGVLSEQKNQMDALKAISVLKSRGYRNLVLHLIGGANGAYLKLLEQYIRDHALDDRVVLHGHQSDVHVLLKDMDLGLMTSRDEAFGRVSVEYMLHGMPVIASKSGANAELVIEGVSGCLYALYDADDLADQIAFFLDNPVQLRSIGSKATAYAKSNFSAKKNAREINTLIRELVNTI